jgi:hypothetical protein
VTQATPAIGLIFIIRILENTSYQLHQLFTPHFPLSCVGGKIV